MKFYLASIHFSGMLYFYLFSNQYGPAPLKPFRIHLYIAVWSRLSRSCKYGVLLSVCFSLPWERSLCDCHECLILLNIHQSTQLSGMKALEVNALGLSQRLHYHSYWACTSDFLTLLVITQITKLVPQSSSVDINVDEFIVNAFKMHTAHEHFEKWYHIQKQASCMLVTIQMPILYYISYLLICLHNF